MAMAHAGMAQHGIAVFAHEQTQGKGQRNKQWHATPKQNIILSVLIQPSGLQLTSFFLFSMAMANAAYQFFNKYAGDDTKVKWPNDLYWRDRKAGGILIENILQGSQWKYAVIGMGININQTEFGNDCGRAVSLKQITGKDYDVIELAKELCIAIEQNIEMLLQSTEAVKNTYHYHLYKIGETVQLKKGPKIFETTIKGVNTNGQLITQNAFEEMFDIGDVEWIFE